MLVYSFVVACVIGLVIQKTIGFRVNEEDEVAGIDSVEHAETAYDLATARRRRRPTGSTDRQAHAEATRARKGSNA